MAKSLTGNAAVEKAKAANSPIYLLNFQDTAGNWYRYATRDIAIGDWGGGQALPGGVAYSDLLKADGLGAISISMETDDGLAYGTDFEFQLQNTGAAKWSSNLATKHFTNQKVFVYLMFDDGTDYMTADMTPMGVYEIRDITVGWPDVVFSCYNAQLRVLDIEIGGNVVEKDKGYRLAPDYSIGKVIPITYGDLDWGVAVAVAQGQETTVGNFRGVQFVVNDTSLVKTHDVDGAAIYRNGQFWEYDTVALPLNKADIDTGKVVVEMYSPGSFTGKATTYPVSGDVFDAVTPAYCIQTLYLNDKEEYTFDEAALGNRAIVRFAFPPLNQILPTMTPSSNEDIKNVLFYAKVETTDVVAAGNSVELSSNTNIIVADDPELIAAADSDYDSSFGGDGPLNLTSFYRHIAAWALGIPIQFRINATEAQTGLLRVFDAHLVFSIQIPFDQEADDVYISIEGTEFNSWIDEDARDNGYNETDLIPVFPYVIESILRDFASRTTADINIVSFDAAGNAVDGTLKTYTAAGQFSEKTRIGDVLGDLARQAGGSVLMIDYEGKFKIIPYVPTTAAYGTTFDQSNIDRETISIEDQSLDEVYTEIYLHWNRNAATDNYDNVSYVKYDENNINSSAAQAILLSTYTNNSSYKNRLDINADFIKSKTVAIATLKAMVGRYGFRHKIVQFKTGMHALDLEVGDFILVDHAIAASVGVSSSDKLEVRDITYYPTSDQIEIVAVGPVQSAVGTTANLTVAYPNGAEVLRIGEDYNILWESEGSIDNVVLDYNKSGGGWISITASTTNDGTYSWTIPNDASAEVKIKITDAGASGATDQSDAYFTIVAKPGETASFSLSNPDGDSVWQIGETYEIRWTGPNTIATVDLHASDDNGASWTITIAEGITNNGSFFWTLPSSLAADTDYKVRVQEAGGGSSDTSAAFSVITNPRVPADPTIGTAELTIRATSDGSLPDGEFQYEDEFMKVTFAFAGRVDGLFRRFEISVYDSSLAPEDGMLSSYRPAAATLYTFSSTKVMTYITDPVNTAYRVGVRAVNIASGVEYFSDWDTAQLDILYSGRGRERGWDIQQNQEENLQSLVSGRSLFLSDGRAYGIDGDPAAPPPPPEVGDIEVGTGDDRRRMRDFWFVDTDGKSYIKKPRDKGDDILIDIDEGIYYGEMDVSAIVSTTMSVLGTLEVFGSVYFNEGHTTNLFSPAPNQLKTPDDFYANALTLAGAINGVTTLNVTTIDLGTNTITDGNLTGTWTGVVDLTASGTIQAEHLYSTDDAVIADDLSVGGDIIFTGADGRIHANTADASDTKYVVISGGGAISDTRGADIALYGNEHASYPGYVFIRTGAIAAAYIEFDANGDKWWLDDGGTLWPFGAFDLGKSGNALGTAYITTLDLGTNTITDGNLTGAWTGIVDLTTSGDIHVGDDLFVLDNGIINIGTGNDLSLYHNATNSYIANITGTLYILAKAAENAIVIVPDGAVTLYYDAVAKFATTATGASVTGTLDVTTVDLGTNTITDGNLTGSWTGTIDLTTSGDVTVGDDLDVAGEIRIGSTTASTGTPKLDVMGTIQAVFSDATADATNKNYRIGGRHYTNAEEPVAIVTGGSTSTSSYIRIGGGTTSLLNSVTSVEIFAAANITTQASSATLLATFNTSALILATKILMPGLDIGSTASEIGDVFLATSKSIWLGNAQEGQIFHNASHGYYDTHVGSLYIRVGPNGSEENAIVAVPNGAVTLYHDNVAKFATSATGGTLTGTLVLTANLTLPASGLINTASGNLEITPAGDIILDPVGNDVLPETNYDINLGMLSKKYLTLHAAELWVETLVAQDTIATIGGRVLVGPTTILTADLTDVATTIYVKHNEMASGDRVYMEADGKVEFMSIDSAPGGAGPYSYTVTRNLDGSGGNVWYAGDAVFNTGAAGDGWIDLYSVHGVKAGTEYGPTIVGNLRNSATYNDWTAHWAIGNLNGLYGYSATEIGVGLGPATAEHVTIDETDIKFYGSDGSTVLGNLNGTTWTLGNASTEHVSISSTAIQLKDGATIYTDLTAGVLSLGLTTAEHILVDTSGVALMDNASVYGLFAATTTIGLTASEHVSISNTSVQIKDGATVYTDLTAGELSLGLVTAEHVLINASGVSLKDNTSVYGVFAATTTIGLTASEHVEITSTAVNFKDGATVYGSLSGTNWVLGVATTEHISITPTAIQFIDNATVYTDLTAGVLSLGLTTAEHVLIDTSGVALMDNASVYGLFAATTTIGLTASEHVSISSTSIQFKDGATVYTDLTAGALTLGLVSQENVLVNSSGIYLRDATTVYAEMSAAGLILGDDATGEYVAIDATNGVRLYGGAVLTAQITNAGLAYLGDQANEHIKLSSTGFEIKDGATVLATYASAVTIGEVAANKANIYITGSGIYMRVNTTNIGYFTAFGLDSYGNYLGWSPTTTAEWGSVQPAPVADGMMTTSSGFEVDNGAASYTPFWKTAQGYHGLLFSFSASDNSVAANDYIQVGEIKMASGRGWVVPWDCVVVGLGYSMDNNETGYWDVYDDDGLIFSVEHATAAGYDYTIDTSVIVSGSVITVKNRTGGTTCDNVILTLYLRQIVN